MMSTVPGVRPSAHIARLDVLRAIAILGVVLFHYDLNLRAWEQLQSIRTGQAPGRPEGAFHAIAAYGASGVALFFVISGFCIQLSYQRRRATFAVRDFYWRRFLRIYPAYLVALLFFSTLGLFKIFSPLNLKMFLTHLFLVHDFLNLPVLLSINGAFWSLAVEWQFYLVFPALLWLATRTSLKTCLVVSLLVAVLGQMLCSAFPAIWDLTENRLTLFHAVFTWPSWILGACLAEAYENRRALFRPLYLWLPLSLALFALIGWLKLTFETRFVVQAFFYAVLMEAYLSVARPLFWLERLLVPVGLVSYSIYLWHMPLVKPLFAWLHRLFSLPESAWAECLLFLPLTMLILSPLFAASYWLLEIAVPRWIARRAAAKGV